jgi:arginine N-succinyltransferase
MLVVRPVRLEDLDALVALTTVSGFGLTSLPKDRDLLHRRISDSLRGFEAMAEEPGGETYLFVMEDRETGAVVGISGIVAKVGGFEPFYAYRVEEHVRESQVLKVRRELTCLHLVAEHSGPCEIGSLFLHPEHRRHGAGRLMSLCRFLFMAEHPRSFDPTVIAEMRGVIDEEGRCPFWEGLGRHFFDLDFPKADYLSTKNKKFIAELMPGHPIYVALLAPDARAAVGRVHVDTEPALRMLEDEGFKYSGMIDIFDGGPVITCPLDEIRTVRESVKRVVSEVAEVPAGAEIFLVGNTLSDFRACLGPVGKDPAGGVVLSEAVAEALGVSAGDPVRYAPVRPAPRR